MISCGSLNDVGKYLHYGFKNTFFKCEAQSRTCLMLQRRYKG